MMLKTHKLIFIFFEFIKKKLNLIQILSSSKVTRVWPDQLKTYILPI
jgi:hypothetical protein